MERPDNFEVQGPLLNLLVDDADLDGLRGPQSESLEEAERAALQFECAHLFAEGQPRRRLALVGLGVGIRVADREHLEQPPGLFSINLRRALDLAPKSETEAGAKVLTEALEFFVYRRVSVRSFGSSSRSRRRGRHSNAKTTPPTLTACRGWILPSSERSIVAAPSPHCGNGASGETTPGVSEASARAERP
jgi:hypothetical protein